MRFETIYCGISRLCHSRSPRGEISSAGRACINAEELVKLTQNHKDLHFAVFEILGCSNGHVMTAPEDLSLKRSDCKWHEYLYNGYCPLRDQYSEDNNSDIFHYF